MSTLPSSTVAVTPAPAPTKTWFGRNWKWFVPTGCLTLLILGVGFFALVGAVVLGSMKNSDVYKMAIDKAHSDVRVLRKLGAPVKPSWYVLGEISVSGGGTDGNAEFTIPISGPRGKAKVYAVGLKTHGKWQIQKLEVAYDDSRETTNLLEPEPSQELY